MIEPMSTTPLKNPPKKRARIVPKPVPKGPGLSITIPRVICVSVSAGFGALVLGLVQQLNACQ